MTSPIYFAAATKPLIYADQHVATHLNYSVQSRNVSALTGAQALTALGVRGFESPIAAPRPFAPVPSSYRATVNTAPSLNLSQAGKFLGVAARAIGVTSPVGLGVVTLGTLAIDHWLKQAGPNHLEGKTYFLPHNEPPASGIELFPIATSRPNVLVRPAKDASLPTLEGYDAHVANAQQQLTPGKATARIDATVPGQKIHESQPRDFIFLSENQSGTDPLNVTRERFEKEVGAIVTQDISANEKIQKLIELQMQYERLKKELKGTDPKAYASGVEITNQLHVMYGNIWQHQNKVREAIEIRYGVSSENDDFDPNWHETNPQAHAEHLELLHRPYDPQALINLSDALLADIQASADADALRLKNKLEDGISLNDLHETMQRRRDLRKKFLGD